MLQSQQQTLQKSHRAHLRSIHFTNISGN